MEETAGPLFKSIPIMAVTIAIDIGPVMSQNSPHPLMALFFNNLTFSFGRGFQAPYKSCRAYLPDR